MRVELSRATLRTERFKRPLIVGFVVPKHVHIAVVPRKYNSGSTIQLQEALE